MTSSIAEYYLDELYDWKTAIDLYVEEIDDAEEWLKDVLRFNTIPDLASKVEKHINQLFMSKQNLLYLRTFVQSFEKQLYKKHAPVNNENITEEQKEKQKQLRKDMHNVEKEYLEVKYNCDDFLAYAVAIQNRNKNSLPV